MIWLIIALLMAGVFALLSVLPTLEFEPWLIEWLLVPTADIWLFLALLMVVGVLIVAQRLRWRWLSFGAVAVLFGLFALRSIQTHHLFEQLTISQPQAVRATVMIDEISDGVYDRHAGTSHRQRAVITELEPVDNLHIHADNAVIFANPFVGDEPASMPTHSPNTSIHLPKQMAVLLTASPKFAKNLPDIHRLTPNTKATMTLLLEPIDTAKSATGFDGNVWLRTRHIHATAKILSIDEIDGANDGRVATQLQELRQRFREHFLQHWQQNDLNTAQAKAVTLSLLTGDRALINRDTKDLYQLAGISHLLAISGTHVVFLAVILAGLLTFVLDKFCPMVYATIPRWQFRMMGLVVASLLYAMFTGFDVPAVRTVYMLLAMAVVRFLVLPLSPLSTLCLVALAMVWLDPYVIWQAGFWLSFVAVLLLMKHENAVIVGGVDVPHKWTWRLLSLLKLQAWLFFAMLPLSILLFGKVSLWGLVSNLFAVGLFGAVIVPINLLAGTIFALSPAFADVLWSVSVWILATLHQGFELFLVDDGWLYAPFGVLGFGLCALLLLPFLTKVLPKRAMILPALAMVFVLMNSNHQAKDNPVMSILPNDNRHLQAVLIRHRDDAWLVLSDSGIENLSKAHIDVIIDGLSRSGVDNLAGVIAQTPSRHLPMMVASIQERIAVQRYWQAGRQETSLTNLVTESCQAGVLYEGGGVSVRALTGWGQIDDVAVWGCSVEFVFDKPLINKDFMNDIDDFSDGMASDVSDELSDDSSPFYGVIINGATDELAWQLWQMLCQSELGIAPRQTAGGMLWLSPDGAVDNTDVMTKFLATPYDGVQNPAK